MAPFNGHPEGFSASTLALLDQGLAQIWHEMQIAADAKTKTAPQPAAASTLSADVQDPRVGRAPPLEPAVAAIVK